MSEKEQEQEYEYEYEYKKVDYDMQIPPEGEWQSFYNSTGCANDIVNQSKELRMYFLQLH